MSTTDSDDRLRILLVDDNADTASVLGALVVAWGFDVRVAHTAQQAIALAQEFRPRVVLLDLGLPDLHGYDAAVRIRQEAGKRQIVFIAITGWTQIADQLKSTAAGISHHLVKPVNPEALRAILDGYRAADSRTLADAGR